MVLIRCPSNQVTKFVRVSVCVLIIVFLCTLYLLSDTFMNKFNYHSHQDLCKWCTYKMNVSLDNSSLPLYMRLGNVHRRTEDTIHVFLVYAYISQNQQLKNKLSVCLSSLFMHTSSALHIHIFTDPKSLKSALFTLKSVAPLVKSTAEVTCHDVSNITKPLDEIIERMRPHFSEKHGTYYSNSLFYISIGMYKVLPQHKIIVIDIDVKFTDDIKDLYAHFNNFSLHEVIGIAREQQPVYRHVLNEYRRLHNDTKAGDPPPNGLTGFNSGVLLLDLQKMRTFTQYSQIVENSSLLLELVEKYKFKGHLGDQDFYTLLSFDYEELFYVLPCTWNRQLCQWWKNHGYKNIFDQYHTCDGKVHLLHGNCNTFISNSS